MMEMIMAKLPKHLLFTAATSLLLVACNKTASKPEGQVVATVDGQEVTINEVNMEASGIAPSAGGVSPKLIESVGLARVIERKMLAAEAKRRKLDQFPQFVLAKTRNDENLLVQALQAEVAGKVSETPREQAQKFIQDNPIIFGDRRVLTLDQIQFLQTPLSSKVPLADAKNMATVERLLLDANVEYRRAPQQIDTLLLDPRLSTEIVRLAQGPNGEPFMFVDQPAGSPAPIVYVNVVSEQKTEPFLGERAISYAQQLIQRQEISKRLQAELTRLREVNKGKIIYAAGYDTPENTAKKLDKAAETASKEKAAQDARAKAGAAKAAAAPAK
jgi:EpsD family peptidyl-prolyl cis-trans isomerase